MLIVSDGAGILGKRVKLAFTSSPRSSAPRSDLSASFSPLLLTPQPFRGPTFLADGALVSVSFSHHLSPQTGSQDARLKSRNDWRCKPLAYSL